MSDFIRSFLEPAIELENLSRMFVFSNSTFDRTNLRRRIEMQRQTLIRLRDRALEHGVPMPPPDIPCNLPPGLKNWKEWDWDFRRAISDLVEACERTAESTFKLAPELSADLGNQHQICASADAT